tara:strand:+ start:419 stop:1048 length:630 start_codon:yes stop_codon:yes gene_type:complete
MTIEDIDEQVKNNPLSKEDLRQQFIEKTEELGIKHTFTFDEAWEVAQELRSRQEYRERITDLQDQMISDGALVGEELHKLNPTKHTFAGGCYIREIFNPANMLITTKIHKKEHPFFLMKGKMSILTENGVETIQAPHHGVTKPGTKRAIFTHEDCVFITVHATDKETPEEVEEEVIAKDFNDPAVALDSIEELSNILGIEVKQDKINRL